VSVECASATGSARRPLPRWAQRLLTREPGTALAIFRFGVGLSLAVALGTVLLHGDVRPLWFPPAHGGYTPHGTGWLFSHLGGAGPSQVVAVFVAVLVAGLCLMVGLGGRIPALVALVGYPALTSLAPDAVGAYDVLMTNALWLLVLGQATATLSLDCVLRTGRLTDPTRRVFAWPRWLALYQLVLVYFTTGIQKVSDTWVPGGRLSAVYYVMQQPDWQRFDMRFLAHVFPLTQAATLAVWCFEVSAPLLLVALALERRGAGRVGRWLRRAPFRRVWAGFGCTFHLGIAATLVLGCFSPLAMSFYAALIPPPKR